MGGFLQYATEKPADVIELRIYAGADGQFVLYEDENDTYNYEKGQHATFEFKWNDKAKTLTIGDRKGTFKGMLNERTFNVVLVKPGVGTGVEISTKIDKTVQYSGKKIQVKL
jgi:alpha-D-xyloside xylohydrolase